MSEKENVFEGWCVLELLGHRRLAGWATEQEIAGAGMLRIDIYDGDAEKAAVTQFYSPSSLYALTPCAEEIARAVGARTMPTPVSRYELEPPRSSYGREHDEEEGWRPRDASEDDRADYDDEEETMF